MLFDHLTKRIDEVKRSMHERLDRIIELMEILVAALAVPDRRTTITLTAVEDARRRVPR